MTRVTFVPTESLGRSGVSIIARRWEVAARRAGLQTGRPAAGVSIEHQVARAEGALVVAGLPFDVAASQSIVDAVASSSRRRIVLWDRAGHTPDASAEGLVRLDGIDEAWILNDLLRGATRQFLPSATVTTMPLAVPDEFLQVTPSPGRPYAAFLGRFSVTKGAPALAATWASKVYPATGLPLVMAGKGMDDGPGEGHVAAVARDHPRAVRTIRLMTAPARARFLASSALVVFPGTHDYLPQALGEALGAAAVVAATGIPGYRPLARPDSTSLLLDVELDRLGGVVEQVLAHPAAATELAQEGRRLVRAEHSVDVTGARLLAALSESTAA